MLDKEIKKQIYNRIIKTDIPLTYLWYVAAQIVCLICPSIGI